ncbi:MAG: YbbR-like protein [Pelotomaculum sp. PtaU1.Bin065]|nr:MAG: YbbR-like protein [Pelotomaculum sp. PtaU1.Bin065]
MQISGPAEAIGDVTEVKTEPVDIRGINNNLVKEIDLIPVPGAAAIYPGRVKVQVIIKKTEAQPEPPPGNGGTEQQRQ